VLLPLASYVLIATAAAARALQASFANAVDALAVVILLITTIRNSWMITLATAGRGKGWSSGKRLQGAQKRGMAPLSGSHASR